MMIEKNVSGLAVVDDSGQLTTNISVTDLRGIGTNGERFSRLFRPIKQYKVPNDRCTMYALMVWNRLVHDKKN